MGDVTRRSLIARGAPGFITASALFSARRASAQLPTLPSLSSSDALLLRQGDAHFADYQTSFNLRTTLKPQLRALCKTPKAAGVMIDWCRSNNLSFAVRCGGHSYEGFSQSTSVVIDTRMMNAIVVDPKNSTATVGAAPRSATRIGPSLRAGWRSLAAAARPLACPVTCSAAATDTLRGHLGWPATVSYRSPW